MVLQCPELQSWQSLLQGTLPQAQQAELSAHLDSCSTCQQTLEGLVASQESWSGAAKELHQNPLDPTGKLGQIMAQLKAKTSAGDTAADGPVADSDLGFLQPAKVPGHLGRFKKYEVLEILGKGGFGTVFKAHDEELDRVVAIKVLAPQLASNATARIRFKREAKAAAAVSHDHVVGIHAVEEFDGIPYIEMQLISGKTLQERLDESGPLELKEILRIGIQTAEGLAAAHKQGLVHRDIKPGNILLENGVERVKITDFGLARAVDEASVTQSGVIAGTPMFMAPEQAAGEPVDHRADLFSLGSVLYTICTGRPPFRASGTMAVMKRVIEDEPTPIEKINQEIPAWLCSIIAKLQAKKPEQRFQSANEVAELLGQHLAHLQEPGIAPRPADVKLPAACEAPAWTFQPTWKHRVLVPIAMFAAFAGPIWAILTLLAEFLNIRGPAAALVGAGLLAASALYVIWRYRRVRLSHPWTGMSYALAAMLALASVGMLGLWYALSRDSMLVIHAADPDIRVIVSKGERQVAVLQSNNGHESVLAAGTYELELQSDALHTIDGGAVERRSLFGITVADLKPGKRIELPIGPGERVTLSLSLVEVAHPDLKMLQGKWPVVSQQLEGKEIDATIKVPWLSFEGDRLKIMRPKGGYGLGKREPIDIITEQRFILDANQTPKQIDLFNVVSNNPTGAGIYQLDGDKLTLCIGDAYKPRPQEFKTRFGTNQILTVCWREPPSQVVDQGFVSLFNGKDLKGWKSPQDLGLWRVENGILSVGGCFSHLYTERGDFENFHLHLEAKINDKGTAAVVVGCPPGKEQPGLLGGHEILISGHGVNTFVGVNHPDFDRFTGTVLKPGQGQLHREKRQLIKPDKWLPLEIIVRDQHITVLVNGQVAAKDVKAAVSKGHLALHIKTPTTALQVRKIEIKELRPTVFDSVRDFSGTQGSGNWSYGYYVSPFTAGTFAAMPSFNDGVWHVQQGAGGFWTSLSAEWGHPNGKNGNKGRQAVEQWPVRRWVSDVAGEITISGTLNCVDGGSSVGRIFVDGKEVFSRALEGDSSVTGGDTSYRVTVSVQLGSRIDFAIDPNGADLDDSTTFTAVAVRSKESPEIKELPAKPAPLEQPRATLPRLDGPVSHLVFSRDGKHLAAGAETTAKTWDVNAGREGVTIKLKSKVRALAFSTPASRIKLLATASDDGTLKFWNDDTGEELGAHAMSTGQVTSAAFSADSRHLAMASPDGAVTIWDVWDDARAKKVVTTLPAQVAPITGMTFSPDGLWLALFRGDKTIKLTLWNTKTGKELTLPAQPRPIINFAFDPDGTRLVTVSTDHILKLWDTQTGQELVCPQPTAGKVTNLAFSPDRKTIAVGYADGVVKLWDMPTWQRVVDAANRREK